MTGATSNPGFSERGMGQAFAENDLIQAARLQAQHQVSTFETGGSKTSLPGYTILREIHRGAQGVVYLAHQEGTRRKVAIKVMRDGPFQGSNRRGRFEREIELLARLRHPSIVAIHDSGEVGGAFFYVMDYIAGHALDEWVKIHEPPVDRLVELFADLADAVNAAHLRGMIHRDLKPGNIRVDAQGKAHILDFGLAKVADEPATEETAETQMTMTGQFVGSLPWASPEQVEGRADELDVRTDVYSIGVMLYQMVASKFPYTVEGPMREVMQSILSATPAPLRQANPNADVELDTIVQKCLFKDRARRYQTAGELARELRRYLAGEPIEAKRDSTSYIIRKTLRRHWLRVSAAGVLAAMLLLAMVLSLTFWHTSRSVIVDLEAQIEQLSRENARLHREHGHAQPLPVEDSAQSSAASEGS